MPPARPFFRRPDFRKGFCTFRALKQKSMANKLAISISFTEYASLNELPEPDRELMLAAQKASETAYAPYSNFLVGTALRLSNGQLFTGSNQENAAYPSGMCAERTALFAKGALFP